MCYVIVNSVVEKERVGEETSGVVGCGDSEFEDVEYNPACEVEC